MISKELFVEIIKFLLKKREQENELDRALAHMQGDEYSQIFIYSEHEEIVIRLLNEVLDLKIIDENIGTDLDYWFYELDCGRSLHKEGKGLAEICYIDNPGDLYDYLIKSSKKGD